MLPSCTASRVFRVVFFPAIRLRDIPNNINDMAVLAFMVANPIATLLSNGKLKIQPAMPVQPKAITANPVRKELDSNQESKCGIETAGSPPTLSERGREFAGCEFHSVLSEGGDM